MLHLAGTLQYMEKHTWFGPITMGGTAVECVYLSLAFLSHPVPSALPIVGTLVVLAVGFASYAGWLARGLIK